MTYLTKLGIFVFLVAFWIWYIPYYHEQRILYEKYSFVLTVECVEGKFHPMVQHNLMTYDGIPTNCSHARTVTSTPVYANALIAMWTDSVFFTLFHATTWQLQAMYVLFVIVVTVTSIMAYSKRHTVNAVMKNQSEAKRRIMLVPAKKPQAEDLKLPSPLLHSK